MNTPWVNLQEHVEDSKVVYSWMRDDHSGDCSLCEFIEGEIRLEGRFDDDISAIQFASSPIPSSSVECQLMLLLLLSENSSQSTKTSVQ